jgi:hypothetical protein
MTMMVLPKSCHPIARSSVFPVMNDERMTTEVKAAIAELDQLIQNKIGDQRSNDETMEEFPDIPDVPMDLFVDDYDEMDWEPIDEDSKMPEADENFSPEVFDRYLTASVLLDRGGESQLGTVVKRKRDVEGNPVGRSNMNPLLDTQEYEVEFPDGSVDILTANAIAEAMYLQVDEEGHRYAILADIIDHRKDGTATTLDDAMIPGTN